MEKATKSRKEREKEARREAILDAAARVLSVKSIYEATLDEIAAEAELAKGTLYNYFKDKQSLFLSLISRGFDRFQQGVSEAIEKGGSLEDHIRRQLEYSVRHVQEHKYMFRIVMSAGGHLLEDNRTQLMEMIRDAVGNASEKLAKTLAALPETHSLTEADLVAGCQLLFATTRQIHISLAISGSDQPPVDEIENYTRLLCRALTAEKPA